MLHLLENIKMPENMDTTELSSHSGVQEGHEQICPDSLVSELAVLVQVRLVEVTNY